MKIGKQRLDKYYHLAKTTGYRARSAYKLLQIHDKHRVLSVRSALDLCSAPGSWLQVLSHFKVSRIVGVDLVPIKKLPNVQTLVCDITDYLSLFSQLSSDPFDLLLNDGAPNVGSDWCLDAYKQNELVLRSFKCLKLLKLGGSYVVKVFRSSDYSSLLFVVQKLFNSVSVFKPLASRNVSAEIYWVCRGFKGLEGVDERFFDPEFVFSSSIERRSSDQPLESLHNGKIEAQSAQHIESAQKASSQHLQGVSTSEVESLSSVCPDALSSKTLGDIGDSRNPLEVESLASSNTNTPSFETLGDVFDSHNPLEVESLTSSNIIAPSSKTFIEGNIFDSQVSSNLEFLTKICGIIPTTNDEPLISEDKEIANYLSPKDPTIHCPISDLEFISTEQINNFDVKRQFIDEKQCVIETPTNSTDQITTNRIDTIYSNSIDTINSNRIDTICSNKSSDRIFVNESPMNESITNMLHSNKSSDRIFVNESPMNESITNMLHSNKSSDQISQNKSSEQISQNIPPTSQNRSPTVFDDTLQCISSISQKQSVKKLLSKKNRDGYNSFNFYRSMSFSTFLTTDNLLHALLDYSTVDTSIFSVLLDESTNALLKDLKVINYNDFRRIVRKRDQLVKRIKQFSEYTHKEFKIEGVKKERGKIDNVKIEWDAIHPDNKSKNENESQSGYIQSNHIQSGYIQSDDIQPNHIQYDDIQPNHIQSDHIKSDHIQSDRLQYDHIQPGYIQSDDIQPGYIHPNHIKSDHIQSNHIQYDDIQPNHIQSDRLQSDDIHPNHIQSNHIQSDRLQSDHPLSDHIQPGYIHPNHIQSDQPLSDHPLSNHTQSDIIVPQMEEQCSTLKDLFGDNYQLLYKLSDHFPYLPKTDQREDEDWKLESIKRDLKALDRRKKRDEFNRLKTMSRNKAFSLYNDDFFEDKLFDMIPQQDCASHQINTEEYPQDNNTQNNKSLNTSVESVMYASKNEVSADNSAEVVRSKLCTHVPPSLYTSTCSRPTVFSESSCKKTNVLEHHTSINRVNSSTNNDGRMTVVYRDNDNTTGGYNCTSVDNGFIHNSNGDNSKNVDDITAGDFNHMSVDNVPLSIPNGIIPSTDSDSDSQDSESFDLNENEVSAIFTDLKHKSIDKRLLEDNLPDWFIKDELLNNFRIPPIVIEKSMKEKKKQKKELEIIEKRRKRALSLKKKSLLEESESSLNKKLRVRKRPIFVCPKRGSITVPRHSKKYAVKLVDRRMKKELRALKRKKL